MDWYIKSTIEHYATAATQAKVTLDSADLELASGEGTLKGLIINNPKGFSNAKALYLGDIGVVVDTSTIRGAGPIIIKHVLIEKPEVTYELLNSGTSNLQTLQENMQNYAASLKSKGSDAAPPTEKTAPNAAGPGRKIIIDDLVLRDGHVLISQEMLQGKRLGTGLPEIHLTNIGKESGGTTAVQVTQQIISAIATSAAQAGVSELANEKISGVLKSVPTSAIGGGAVNTLGKQLKGVFGQ